jgi:hypothetical protein
MMTKLLSVLLLTSVLAIGVFGFVSMNHRANHAVGCTVSAVDDTPCPENIVAMAVHHIQAFSSFFSVVPSIPFIFFLALLFTLFLSVGFFSIKHQDSVLASRLLWRVLHDPERQLSRPRKITRWLSLFENSPSLHRISITIFDLKNLCKQKRTKTIKILNSLNQKWHLILSAEWNLMQTTLRQVQITKVKPTTFALSTVRITLQPIR